MSVLLIVPVVIALLCPILIYLFKRNTDPESKTISFETSSDKRPQKNKETKLKKSKTQKVQSQPTIRNNDLVKTESVPEVKPKSTSVKTIPKRPKSNKITTEEPKPETLKHATDFIDDFDESPQFDSNWIAVETKKKVKIQPEKKPSKKTQETPNLPQKIDQTTQKPVKDAVVVAEPKINKLVAPVVAGAAPSPQSISPVIHEIILSERNALRSQVSQLQIELEAYIIKYEALTVNIKKLEASKPEPKKTIVQKNDEDVSLMRQKLNDAQKEIEQLKLAIKTASAPAPTTDPVVLKTIQDEIKRLAGELMHANQRNDSMKARLEHAERELERFRKQSDTTNNNLIISDSDGNKNRSNSSPENKVARMQHKSSSDLVQLEAKLKETIKSLEERNMECQRLKEQLADSISKTERIQVLEDQFNREVEANDMNQRSRHKELEIAQSLQAKLAKVEGEKKALESQVAELKMSHQKNEEIALIKFDPIRQLKLLLEELSHAKEQTDLLKVLNELEAIVNSKTCLQQNGKPHHHNQSIQNGHEHNNDTLDAWKHKFEQEQKHRVKLEETLRELEKQMLTYSEVEIPELKRQLMIEQAKKNDSFIQMSRLQALVDMQHDQVESGERIAEELRSKIRELTHND